MLLIDGGKKLYGEVFISGSKNSALPILCISLLSKNKVVIHNVPDILDIRNLFKIFDDLNVSYQFKKNKFILFKGLKEYRKLNLELSNKLRGSIYLMAVNLAMFRKTNLILSGGCKIGNRGYDLHYDIFNQLGFKVEENDIFYEEIKTDTIYIKRKTVGGTINALIVSSSFKKIIRIYNYSNEPEVMDVIEFLKKMGHAIFLFNDYILISQNKMNKHIKYKIKPDRIEAASYINLGALLGNLKIKNVPILRMKSYFKTLDLMNIKYKIKGRNVLVKKSKIKSANICASNYPSFPTDMLPLMIPLLLHANKSSFIKDLIFPNRYQMIDSMKKMGASLDKIDSILIKPSQIYSGSDLYGYDLRGGFSILILMLKANGKSYLMDSNLIDRGYENYIKKLKKIHANIKLVE